jgi:molecular chaperone GrpE
LETEDEKSDAAPETELKQLKQELAIERKRSEELLTRMKYLQADLENQRKRMDRELKVAGESLTRSLLTRLMVVQDELDLAVKHAEEEGDSKELNEGIAMIQRNLWSAMESAGVERIDCVGKPFDPTLHEAVEKVQGKSAGEDTVVEEVRPGFMFRGQLLRPSMVKVELGMKETEQEAKTNE